MSKIEKNWLEWLVFALGLVLVAGAVGYLVYDGATLGDSPPSIELVLGTPEQKPHAFIVPVTLINHGDETAEGVEVEVTLEQAGAPSERGHFTIAFLPRRARREAWVAFQTDPRGGQLKPRVLGYEKP